MARRRTKGPDRPTSRTSQLTYARDLVGRHLRQGDEPGLETLACSPPDLLQAPNEAGRLGGICG